MTEQDPGHPSDLSATDGRPRRDLVALAAIVVLVAGAVAAVLFLSQDDDAALGSVRDITVSDFGTNEPLPLSSFAGKPLVVNYWASWCTFCIEEMPGFQNVYEDVSPRVEFVGIDIQDRHDAAAKLAETTGVRYPLATDEDASSYLAVDGIGMPTTLFVNEDGTIIERFTGPLTERQLRDKLTEHFGI